MMPPGGVPVRRRAGHFSKSQPHSRGQLNHIQVRSAFISGARGQHRTIIYNYYISHAMCFATFVNGTNTCVTIRQISSGHGLARQRQAHPHSHLPVTMTKVATLHPPRATIPTCEPRALGGAKGGRWDHKFVLKVARVKRRDGEVNAGD